MQPIHLSSKAPYITSITPDYGPVSGGTNIYLYGGYLGNVDAKVLIGDTECKPRVT